jgi:chemotaxis protein MotB
MAESENGSGEWLTTYADFITLLMTFFLMLYALTSGVDKHKFEAMLSVFQHGKGIVRHQKEIQSKIPPRTKHRQQNWHKFNKLIKERNLENQVQFKMVPNGVYITLGGPVTFKTYSAELKPQVSKILKTIAQSIQNYSYEPLKKVKVFGNTDSRPVAENATKFPSNWALGAARAISVIQFLNENSTVPSKKFEAVSFGKYHPVASNETEVGRRKNRRVKIYVEYADKQTKGSKTEM